MNFSIVIPCLNEAETVENAIDIARKTAGKYKNRKFEIIIADNGSTDGTLKKLKKIKYIKVIQVPIRGYGAALHWGILSAKYPYVLFADADLSYDFSEVPKFLPFLEKDSDLVLGSRIRGKIAKGAMPALNRYFGTPVLTFLIRHIYKINTTDCNSGMRMVKKDFYKNLQMKNSGMEWASELLIRTALSKGKYFEIPINFQKDKRGRKPHLKRWEDGWRHLKAILLFKPSLLVLIASVLAVIGIIFIPISLFTTIAMFLSAEFFIFSYLATKKIQSAFEEQPNKVGLSLDHFPLVFIAVILTIFGFFSLLLISDNHLFTKYILLFQIIIFDLWLFFIETIKTHLINPLPKTIT